MLDRTAMNHGGLGAIRSLGRLGVPVYGVHDKRWAPAAGSRYLHGRWCWQPPADDLADIRDTHSIDDTQDAERLQAGLIMLAQRIGRRAVLIATDDAGALFLAEHGAALRQWYLFPDPPRDLPRRLADQYSLHRTCRELGVPSVARALPGSLAEAEEFAEQVGYPLIAKFAGRRRPGRGSRPPGSTVLTSRDDLVRSYLAGAGPLTAEVLLQEHLPRCPSQDYFFHGYCDADSRCRPGFVGIKERSYPAHTGLTSLGRWVDNDQLHTQATELVAQLGYQGILDLDYRWDPRHEQYKLLNFTPRLGSQFRLFQDDAGIDVVVAAHLDLTGRPIPPGSQLAGRRFLVENYDPIAALGYRRNGELSLLWWLMSLRLVDEMAWYARDDLAPFGLMCLRMGWQAMGPLTQRLTRGLTLGLARGLTRTVIRPRGTGHTGHTDGTGHTGGTVDIAAPARAQPGRALRRSGQSAARQSDKVLQ